MGAPTYTIVLRGVRFRGRFGASRAERDLPQDVTVDVTLALPFASMPARDRVRDVFDYDAVVRRVVEEGTSREHRLLETYARQVLDRLMAETPAMRIVVSVTKERAPTTHSVDAITVELTASRDG